MANQEKQQQTMNHMEVYMITLLTVVFITINTFLRIVEQALPMIM